MCGENRCVDVHATVLEMNGITNDISLNYLKPIRSKKKITKHLLSNFLRTYVFNFITTWL